MQGRAYTLWACPLCNREFPGAGQAKVSHLRKHVRDGEAVEARHPPSKVNRYGYSEFERVIPPTHRPNPDPPSVEG